MKNTVRLTENDIEKMVIEVSRRLNLNKVNEELTRGDVEDEIEDYTKSKDFEKKVHNVVVDALNELVQNIWTKKSFWTTMLKKK